jgi:hypothetical protein
MKKYYIIVLALLLLTATGCSQSIAAARIETDAPGEVTAEQAVAEQAAAQEEAPAEAPSPEIESEALPVAEPANAPPDTVEAEADAIKTGYYFDYNGTPVYLGDLMTNVLGALGPELEFYEAPSCAYDGMAKMYVYAGFELATYIVNENDDDRLYSITFFDDSVATAEGAYIGQSYDDMIALYGDGYEEIPGAYLYTKDGAVLSFTMEDQVITVIQYYVQDIYG